MGGSMAYAQETHAMEISSLAFKNGSYLPIRYTCDGENISPPLEFHNVCKLAKSLVLIFDDPDAPNGTWIHWILYNLPPTIQKLDENIQILPQGTKSGLNSWGKIGYGGACPPNGEHRYKFKIYALDFILNLEEGASLSAVEKAMDGHIIEMATLTSPYKRSFN